MAESAECVLRGCECGAYCRLCAENVCSQSCLGKAGAGGCGELRVGPSALGADRNRKIHRLAIPHGWDLGFEHFSHRFRASTFRKQEPNIRKFREEHLPRLCCIVQHRDAQTPGLLCRLKENLFPSRRALCGRSNQSLFAAFRRQWHDFVRSELGGFFDRPFEAVELDDGEEQRDSQQRQQNREAFDKGEFDRVAPNFLRACQPHGLSVAQFVELARLCTQDARKVMGRFAVQNGGGVFKPLDKESPAHRALCYINRMGWCCGAKDAQRSGAFRLRPVVLLSVFLLACVAAQAQPRPAYSQRVVIVDTDAGSDDLMAIAFLLSRPDIHVEAITIVNGMAHVQAGGRNVLRLLALAGRHDVRVYLGRETPLSGTAEFPTEWRRNSDELPGVTLPEPTRTIESQPAAEFLARRLADAAHPVQVLTLGPLTNLADAFSHMPRAVRAIRQLVIMGGAVRVPGNLADGGAFKTDNGAAEWNMFIDPVAAKMVFASGAPIRLVPLDATQRVPIDMALLEQMQSKGETPVARFVAQVLATNRDFIRQGFYFAWDPLAAVALANPAVATFKPLAIEISQKPQELGRTTETKGRRANAQVGVDADRLRFRDIFMTALGVR